jgi:hypothetical protein
MIEVSPFGPDKTLYLGDRLHNDIVDCGEARLCGWLSVVVDVPGPLALPLADRLGAPDRFAAYPAVGGGHLPAGHVCADGGRRDIEVAGNVACRPPVTRQRLGHADQITALTLPDRGWRLRARSP